MKRFPSAPLVEAAKSVAQSYADWVVMETGQRFSINAKGIADALGVHHTTVTKWVTENRTLWWVDADRYAIRLGLHPVLIWPEWVNVPKEETVEERRARDRARRAAYLATPKGRAAAAESKRKYEAKRRSQGEAA